MSFELKDGSGSLFRNDKKTTDTHPDYSGSLKINGVEYWLSGWIKDGAKGRYLSLSAKQKQESPAGRVRDADVPF